MTTIDLCAGIGGIRRGFELAGNFENILTAEIDEAAQATYSALFGKTEFYDVTDEDSIVEAIHEMNRNVDVVLAGFPCQAFSLVGKREGFNDPTRGTIFFNIRNLIARLRPKAFFLENVSNLFSHDKGATFKRIIDVLENDLNYKVIGVDRDLLGNVSYVRNSFVRNSCYFGLPQNRPRTYIMGFSRNEYGDAIQLLDGLTLPTQRDREPIVRSLDGIIEPEVDLHYYLSSGLWKTLKKHKVRQSQNNSGFGYSVVYDSQNDEGNETKLAHTVMATGGSGKERNLVRQPCNKLYEWLIDHPHDDDVFPGKKSNLNRDYIRVMTPTEWGRLQGFIGYGFMENGIDRFHFPEGMRDTPKYKQFGNSVTIPVIETMAQFMIRCFRLLGEDIGEDI